MPEFTYDIGYYGKVSIDEQGFLATGGNISIQYSPLFTTGVWGANWRNVTEKIAYAPNYVTLSASVNYQLTTNIASKLSQFAFSQRNEGKQCKILPNGVAGYSGTMWCTGCGFSTSQDSLVTGDVNLQSGNVKNEIIISSNTSDTPTSSLQEISPDYKSVYPYWGSCVKLDIMEDSQTRIQPQSASTMINDIIDWSASYNSQLVFVSLCNYTNEMLQAQYAALGSMQAQGSFTMFRIGQYLKAQKIQRHNKCSIHLRNAKCTDPFKILYGAIVWTSASTDVQNGSSLIQSSFGFNALGNTTKAPMDLASGQ